MARLIAEQLSQRFGQQVIVDNRGGGDGIIAAELFHKATPDGHTLLLASSALVIRPLLHPNKVYQTYIDEFVPVTSLSSANYILVVNVSVPVNNLKEFIAFAKAKPTYFKAGA